MSPVIQACGACTCYDPDGNGGPGDETACVPGFLCPGESGAGQQVYLPLSVVQAAGGYVVKEIGGVCYEFDAADVVDPCPGTTTAGTTYADCRLCRSRNELEAACCAPGGVPIGFPACSYPVGVPKTTRVTYSATLTGQRGGCQDGVAPQWSHTFGGAAESDYAKCFHTTEFGVGAPPPFNSIDFGVVTTSINCSAAAIDVRGSAQFNVGGYAALPVQTSDRILFQLIAVSGEVWGLTGEIRIGQSRALVYWAQGTNRRALREGAFSPTFNHDGCGNGTARISGSVNGSQSGGSGGQPSWLTSFTFDVTIEEIGLYPCPAARGVGTRGGIPVVHEPPRRAAPSEMQHIIDQQMRGGGCRTCGDGFTG